MARIEVTTHVEAPPSRVWEVLVDWEGQARWMVDVRDVQVLTERREDVGVTVRCRTDILGRMVHDELTVIEWDPPRALGMRHAGRLIRGIGTFELEPTPAGTRVVWWEEAAVPFGGVGDALADLLVVPWVARVFRRSLARLKRLCESSDVG